MYSSSSNNYEENDSSNEDFRRVIDRTVSNFFKTFEEEHGIQVNNIDCDDDVTVFESYGKSQKLRILEQKIRVNYRKKVNGEDFNKVFLEKARSEEY